MGAIPNILSIVTFLPLVGALAILICRLTTKNADGLARWVALGTTLVTLAVSCVLVGQFDPSSATPGSPGPSTIWVSTGCRSCSCC